MTSRFFARGSSSEEDTESETEETTTEEETTSSDESSDEEDQQKSGVNRFLRDDSDDESDSDEARRVVRSAKDKRFDEIKQTAEEIRNKIKINDWVGISNNFDKLNKQLDKIRRSGNVTKIPKVYIRALVEMEDFLAASLANKEARKKMSSSNAKALNSMRQNLKKNNKNFESEIKTFRETPQDSDSEDESEEYSDSYESASEDELDEGGEFEQVKSKAEREKDKFMQKDPKDITYGMVMKRSQELIMQRGKKGTDRKDMVLQMKFLVDVAKTQSQKAQMMINLINAYFDMSSSLSMHVQFPLSIWNQCCVHVVELLEHLEEFPYITVESNYEQDYSEEQEGPEEGATVSIAGNLLGFLERLDDEWFKSLQVTDPHTNDYLNRMKDEPIILAIAKEMAKLYTKAGATSVVARISLRELEHYYYKTSAVYTAMRNLTEQQQKEAAEARTEEGAKTNGVEAIVTGAEEDTADAGPQVRFPKGFHMEDDMFRLVKSKVTYIYKHADERTKARAMLCDIYHHSIHDDFHTARELLLMSHLQDTIHNMDISTQILFNRSMAQIGLCAFRKGLIQEAHYCLSELYGSGRIRELLAQGMAMRWHDRTPEQEKLEKRRQMPFHMHINLDLLESVNLLSAMLLETSLLGTRHTDSKRRISKSFWRLIEHFDKLTFLGPPESIRDHVITSTYALARGSWKKAYDTVACLPVWDLLPQKTDVLAMLCRKIKEESLKIYVTIYGPHYSSLSVSQLCEMFELSSAAVHSLVSRMMMNEEVQGSWHQPTQTIVMRNMETSALQKQAMQTVDKIHMLVDNNEKALGLRTGSLRERDDDGDEREGRRGRRDGGRGGGRDYGDRKGNWDGRKGQGRSNVKAMGRRAGWEGGDRRQGGRGGGGYQGGRSSGGRGNRHLDSDEPLFRNFSRKKEERRELQSLGNTRGRG